MKKRNGEERLNKTSYGFPVEQLLNWPRDDGKEILLAVVGTSLGYNNLCLVNEEDYSLTPLCSVGDAKKVSTFYFKDKLYINDGSKYWEYDGQTMREIYQPDSPQSLTVAATYSPSTAPTIQFSNPDSPPAPMCVEIGTHTVIVTFVDKNNNESPGSPPATAYTGTRYRTLNITNIPTGPEGTQKRNIYRRMETGDFYLITTLNDNTTTTFTHEDPHWQQNVKSKYTPPLEAGAYKCAYTHVSNSGFESEPSPVERIKLVEGQCIKWTLSPITEGNIRLYRTEPDGETLKFIAEISGDTTEYLDYVGIYGDNIKANNNLDAIRNVDIRVITRRVYGASLPATPTTQVRYITANTPTQRRCLTHLSYILPPAMDLQPQLTSLGIRF